MVVAFADARAGSVVPSFVHANGVRKTATDQREVLRTYAYDDLSRLTADRVTSLGRAAENVDGAGRSGSLF